MAMNMDVAFKISAGVTGQQAVDRLKDSLTGVERAGLAMKSSFTALGTTLAGAFSVGAVVALGQQIVQAAREAELADNKIQGLLRATQYSAGLAAESLDAMATALAESTQFDDETVKAAIATFLRFGNIQTEVFEKGITLSADLAAALGTDLPEAANTLGKALSSPTEGLGALQRAGFRLTESQKDQITALVEAGRLQEAQVKVLELVQGRVGGLAQELNTGLNKELNDVSKNWGDLLEALGKTDAIGGTAERSLRGLAGILKGIRTEVENGTWLERLMEASARSLRFAPVIGPAMNVLGSMGGSSGPSATGTIPPAPSTTPTGPGSDAAMAGAQAERLRQQEESAAQARKKAAEEAAKAAERTRQQVDSTVRSLVDQTRAANELSNVETQLLAIQEGRYGNITAKQREVILNAAQELDQAKAKQEAERELARISQEAARENARIQEEAERKRLQAEEQVQNRAKQIFEQTRTPVETLNIEMAELDDLLAKGAINWDTYSRAVLQAVEKSENFQKDTKDGFAELESVIRGFGSSFTNTLTTSFQTGKFEFKGLVSSILADLARLTISKGITEPIFGAISKSIGAGTGGSTLFNTVRGFFGFANGGIMTGNGPLPLNYYSNGGVANSPQMAVFGEGRTPEAFVPLPDGRAIPVKMEGGGGNVVVNVNVESGKTQTEGTAGKLGQVIAATVRDELIKQKRPGGLLAA